MDCRKSLGLNSYEISHIHWRRNIGHRKLMIRRNKPSKPQSLQTNSKSEEEEDGMMMQKMMRMRMGRSTGRKKMRRMGAKVRPTKMNTRRSGCWGNGDDRVTTMFGFVCVCVFVCIAFLCSPNAQYIRSFPAQHCEHRRRLFLIVDHNRLS